MSLDWARSVVHPRHAGAWREGPLALLLAGLDGIRRQIDPGGILAIDAPHPPEGQPDPFLPLPTHLHGALDALAADQAFLLEGDVFSSDWIAGWIERQRRRVRLPLPEAEPLRPT